MPNGLIQVSSLFWDEPGLTSRGVQWLPPHQIIVSWDNDAIFTVNVKTGDGKRFFYPGGNLFTIQPQKDGYVAIYADGTQHLWVFHP